MIDQAIAKRRRAEHDPAAGDLVDYDYASDFASEFRELVEEPVSDETEFEVFGDYQAPSE